MSKEEEELARVVNLLRERRGATTAGSDRGGSAVRSEQLFRCNGIEAEAWDVIASTPRTWTVRSTSPHLLGWKRTVRASQIGGEWFATAHAALTGRKVILEGEIAHMKDRLQQKRTMLGMVESALRKVTGGGGISGQRIEPGNHARANHKAIQEPS